MPILSFTLALPDKACDFDHVTGDGASLGMGRNFFSSTWCSLLSSDTAVWWCSIFDSCGSSLRSAAIWSKLLYKIWKKKELAKLSILQNPKLEVNYLQTNTYNNDEQVINLFHKLGTIEHYHTKLKTDKNLKKFP